VRNRRSDSRKPVKWIDEVLALALTQQPVPVA